MSNRRVERSAAVVVGTATLVTGLLAIATNIATSLVPESWTFARSPALAWSLVGLLLVATVVLATRAARALADDTERSSPGHAASPGSRQGADEATAAPFATPPCPEPGPTADAPPAVSTPTADAAPSPARRYASRETEVSTVRAALTEGAARRNGNAGVVAVVGMGGVGKTSLLIELADEVATARAWPRPPIWLACGASRSAVELQGRLASSLGVSAAIGEDVEENRRALARAAAQCPGLVVLDDVQTVEQIRALVLDSPGAPTVLSTRSWTVVDAVGATGIALETTDGATTRRILAAHVGCTAAEVPEAGMRIARACGGLPLALAVAGAMIRNRVYGWSELDESLSRPSGRAALLARSSDLPGYEPTSLHSVIERSLDGLTEAERRALIVSAVLVRSSVFPRAVFRDATAHLHEGSAHRCLETEERLVERSLLGRRIDDEGNVELIVHDLIVDFCHEVNSTPSVDTVLVDNILARLPTEDAPLPSLRALLGTSYYRDELLTHIVRAGRDELAVSILCDSEWMVCRLAEYGARTLVDDLSHGGESWPLPTLRAAVVDSAGILSRRPDELVFQLEARVPDAVVARVRRDAEPTRGAVYRLRPLPRESFRRDGRLTLTLHGSTRPLVAMALVPGRDHLVTVDLDGVVDLVDLADGRSRATARLPLVRHVPTVTRAEGCAEVLVHAGGGHALLVDAAVGEVRTVAHDPDASGPDSHAVLGNAGILRWSGATATLRDLRTSEPAPLIVADGPIRCGDADPRSSLVAVADSQQVRWCAPAEGRAGLFRSPGDITGIRIVDRHRLLTFTTDGSVTLFDVGSGTARWTSAPHTDWIECHALEPHEELLATGGHDHRVVVTSLRDGHTVFRREERAGYVQAVHLWRTPPGRGGERVTGLAWSPLDESVRLRQLAGDDREALLLAHSARVNALTSSEDGATVLSCADDGTVRAWSTVAAFDPAMQPKKDHRERVSFACRVGTTIWSGSYDGSVAVWRPDGERVAHASYEHGPVHVITPLGRDRCLVGFESGALVRLDLVEHDQLDDAWTIDVHAWVSAAALVGDVLYVGAGDGTVRVVDRADGRLVERAVGHDAAVRCFASLPDGSALYSGGEDGRLVRWSTADLRREAENHDHTDWINGLALDPARDRLHSVSDDGTLRTVDALHLRSTAPAMPHAGWLQVLCMLEGSLVACGGQDATVSLWDTDSGARLLALPAHEAGVTSLARLPGTDLLLSTGADGKVALWTGPELRAVCTATMDAGVSVNTLTVGDDGGLAFGCDDGTMHFLRACTPPGADGRDRSCPPA